MLASTVWAPYTSSIEKLEAQRHTAIFTVSDYDYSSSISSILNQLNWPSIASYEETSFWTYDVL